MARQESNLNQLQIVFVIVLLLWQPRQAWEVILQPIGVHDLGLKQAQPAIRFGQGQHQLPSRSFQPLRIFFASRQLPLLHRLEIERMLHPRFLDSCELQRLELYMIVYLESSIGV